VKRVLLTALLLSSATAQAQERPHVVVGTHEIPPFVIKNADGTWSGISIDLWRRIAEDRGYETEIRDLSVAELVAGPENVDVVASLTIDSEREATFDLTHAFYSTGLAIAVVPHESSIVDVLSQRVLTKEFLLAVGAVALLLLAAAFVMWRIEHRHNDEEFGGKTGIIAGLMWSVETVIGYNDPQHKTRTGRAFGILWAIFGVVLVSALTAELTSALTLEELGGDVRSIDDLPRVTVGTVQRSPASRFLSRRGIRAREFPDVRAALRALERGDVGAVVYEAPVLAYAAADRPSVRVLPGTFDNHGYGFGLRPGSPLREDIDRAMLRIVASDDWHATLSHYLGPR
jgi:polar amino acid transport system substrate-binding protein